MQCKSVYSAALGHRIALGRIVPDEPAKVAMMAEFGATNLPPPPATADYGAGAQSSLGRTYLNNVLGTCVLAAVGHAIGVWTGNAGSEVELPDTLIMSLYKKLAGYDPRNPRTDRGMYLVDALRYAVSSGFVSGDPFTAFLAVNPHDPLQLRQALFLFETLLVGSALPDAALRDVRPDFVWHAGPPDPQNGHAFMFYGYNQSQFRVSTWGMSGWADDSFVSGNCDEVFVPLSRDLIAKAQDKAPNGLDWRSLIGFFNSMGGDVPIPPSPPPPSPEPSFDPVITLAQALPPGRFHLVRSPAPWNARVMGTVQVNTPAPRGDYAQVPAPRSEIGDTLPQV